MPANRFARDLTVQETGWRFLQGLGVTLIAVDSPDSFLDTTPTAVLIRQVLGAVSQFEKAALVAKLRAARERKKRETGKCGGRRSVTEANPATVALAKKLARYPVNGRRRCRGLARGRTRDKQGHGLRRRGCRPNDRLGSPGHEPSGATSTPPGGAKWGPVARSPNPPARFFFGKFWSPALRQFDPVGRGVPFVVEDRASVVSSTTLRSNVW